VLACTGSDSPVEYRPLPTDDPARRCPDITLARDLLGWEPVVNLDEGLPRTVEYFRQALNASLPLLERPMAEVAAD
jgi:nucleoside-diphosphate-sugar epimerase